MSSPCKSKPKSSSFFLAMLFGFSFSALLLVGTPIEARATPENAFDAPGTSVGSEEATKSCDPSLKTLQYVKLHKDDFAGPDENPNLDFVMYALPHCTYLPERFAIGAAAFFIMAQIQDADVRGDLNGSLVQVRKFLDACSKLERHSESFGTVPSCDTAEGTYTYIITRLGPDQKLGKGRLNLDLPERFPPPTPLAASPGPADLAGAQPGDGRFKTHFELNRLGLEATVYMFRDTPYARNFIKTFLDVYNHSKGTAWPILDRTVARHLKYSVADSRGYLRMTGLAPGRYQMLAFVAYSMESYEKPLAGTVYVWKMSAITVDDPIIIKATGTTSLAGDDLHFADPRGCYASSQNRTGICNNQRMYQLFFNPPY